ncbi:protein O-mannosyl-transferase TMTC2-like [Ornithodoros turicata]
MTARGARAQARREPAGHQTRSSRKLTDMEYYGSVALVSGLACLLYWNTLDADFAYDDSRAIRTNQDLLPSSPLTSLFRNDFWGTPLTHSGSHKSYRPLCVLSFRLNYLLGGYDPRGYHLFNVLLHGIVSGLFTVLVAKFFIGQPLPTLVAGLLFAVHPIHTEAVAGIVGRADIGACLFFLGSLLSYMQYCKYRDKAGDGWRWMYLYASLALAGCSMLTKEHGITVLTVCVIYDVFINHRVAPRDLPALLVSKRHQGLWEGLLHLGCASAALVGLRLHLMGSRPPDFAPADNPTADSESLLTRTLTFLYLPAFNAWLLLCPRWLSFDWSMEAIPLVQRISDPRNLISASFYAGLLHLVATLVKRLTLASQPDHRSAFGGFPCPCLHKLTSWHKPTRRTLNNNFDSCVCATSYSSSVSSASSDCSETGSSTSLPIPGHLDASVIALALLVLPFVPATNLFFYVGFVVAERVLYLPSMGFCMLVAIGADNLCGKRESRRRTKVLLLCVAFVLVTLSVRTVRRNRDWSTEEDLYRSGIEINPPKSYGNLANILSARGRKTEAEWAYKKALSYRSNMADVHYNLGILLQEQNRLEEALQSYKMAIQFRPRLAMAHLNMGLVLGIMGRKDEAIEVYRHCAQLDSAGLKDPKMHESTKISALFNLGRLYADEGKYKEAITVYQEAVAKMPDHYQPQSLYNMMGEAYFKLGEYVEAERWYKEALRAKHDHIPAHLTYAKLLSKWNRPTEAEQWFLRAKGIAPNDSSVYQHYGQFLSESDRHMEAAENYLRAAELSPDEYEIIFNTANTLRQAGRNAEAEAFYQAAVKLRPQEVTSHMNLGAMLHVNGKLLEAESSYLEALRLKPDDPITQNNLQKLRNLLVQRGLRSSTVVSHR